MSTGKPKLLCAVTVPLSAKAFFRGRLAYLRQQGYDVHLVSSPGPELEEVGQSEGVVVHALPMRRPIALFSDIVSLFRACRLVRRLRPDIVDAGTPKAGLLFSLAAAACGVPCRVYSMYGLRLESTRGPLRWLLAEIERVSCACAHRVTCLSPSLRRRVLALGLARPGKLVVFGSGSIKGVSVERFALTTAVEERVERLRRDLGIAAGAPVVGFVGRLVRDKGIAELVDAWLLLRERIPDVTLLLVGQFEEGDPVDARTRQLSETTSGVHVVGWVKDVVPCYYTMDVLAAPTHREGFGEVALEAAAAGRPVVTTNATGAVDAVVDGVTGFVVPVGNATALADALGRLLDNPGQARQMGEAGRQRAIVEFKPERIWRGVDGLYREMLGEVETEARTTVKTNALKRMMDVVGAVVGLVLLSPLLAVVALLTWFAMGRPVLFVQERPGLRGRPFRLVKFRTMRRGSGADAERLTGLGRFMRKFSLDELPELWNVLKGDMSLVGPRPLLMEYLDRYTPEQARRHEVKPGITGWAQVNGRNAISWEQKFALDVWYVDHQSAWLDLRVLLLTVWRVMRREGISQQGQATMEEFLGDGRQAATRAPDGTSPQATERK